jgi:hypothetical protein
MFLIANRAFEGSKNEDLKESENWREEAIKRFKNKIGDLESEDKIVDYLISDLRKFGYKPYYKQKQGFRKEAIH